MLDPYSIASIGEWMASRNTGMSSLTMAAIFLGAEKGDFCEPADAGDFGRCLALLEKVPEIRLKFMLIAWHCPSFLPILKRWDELAGLYQDGKRDDVSRLLRELREVKS